MTFAESTPQLRCFSALASAAEALAARLDCDAHVGLVLTPHSLLRELVASVAATGGQVLLRHALVVHDSLRATLSCGDAVLEAEIACRPRAIADVLLLKEALEQAA